MTKNQNKSIESLMAEALEILGHAELSSVEGGVVMGPGCPGWPPDDPTFAPFGPTFPPFGPIC